MLCSRCPIPTLEVTTDLLKITRDEPAKKYRPHAAPVGEAHPRAKLTDLDVEHIRILVAEGMTYVEVCGKFGVTKGYVSKLINRHARF
jgi:predicted DNA-binding protein (UPF0251 family)